MNKKANAYVIGAITLLLLVIVGIGTVNYVNFGRPFAVGFSTLSISTVDYTSNHAAVGGPAFLLTVVQNGAGQSAFGTFKSISSDGVTATKDFTLQLDLIDQQCVYDLRTTTSTIKRLEVIKSGTFSVATVFNRQYELSKCGEVGGYFSSQDGVTNIAYVCTKYVPIARQGNAAFNTLLFKTDVIGQIEGEAPSKATISNAAQTSVNLYGGDVYASWQGFLASGQQCPTQSDYGVHPVYRYTTSGYLGWVFTSDNAVNSYKNYEQAGYEQCLGFVKDKTSGYTYSGCVQKFNNYANAAINPVSFADSKYGVGSEGSGSYKISLGDSILFPVISMRIKAERLGIFIPVGDPDITKVTSSCFGTGEPGSVAVTVYNDGTVYSSFDVSVSCPSPFTVSSQTKKVQLSPGAGKTVTFILNGDAGTSSQVKKVCTVTASDVEYPAAKDTASFTACVNKITVPCDEGAQKCIGDVQHLCVGGEWQPTSSDACKDLPPPPPPPNLLVKIIAGVVLLLLTALFVGLAFTREGLLGSLLFGALALSSLIGVLIISMTLFSGVAVWLFFIGLILIIIGMVLLMKGVGFGAWLLGIGALLFVIGALIGVTVLYSQTNQSLLSRITGWFL